MALQRRKVLGMGVLAGLPFVGLVGVPSLAFAEGEAATLEPETLVFTTYTEPATNFSVQYPENWVTAIVSDP